MMDSAATYKAAGAPLYIETSKGRKFYFDSPLFDAEEIAHALSMQCRFTGHCARFYSVAEHSILVAALMRDLNLGDPFEGLMHDASEAYLSDMSAPAKAMLPDYKALEKKLDREMRLQFGLAPTISDGCKRADWLALFIEAYWLLPTRGADWIAPEGIKEQAFTLARRQGGVACIDPEIARETWLSVFRKRFL